MQVKTDKRWALVAMVMASGVVFLDSTVINVALPAIDRDLSAGLAGLQWIVDSYALTLAAFIILGGAIGDQYGRRKVMLAGLVGFGITSAACGLAPTAGWLIGARTLQGVSGAFIVPGSLAVLTAIYEDKEERGRAIGTWAGWSGISSVIAPFVGGFLIDNLSWRWVFFLNLPLIAVACWLMLTRVPETSDHHPERQLDWLAAFLTVIGLCGVTYALIEGPSQGWDLVVIAALVVGVVAVGAFLAVESRVKNPMVPLGLFRSRNFSGTNLATFVMYGSLYGMGFILTLYLQNVMGYSALLSGVVLLPMSILMLFLSPRFGSLAGRYGPRLFMAVGPIIFGAGLLLLLRLQPGGDLWFDLMPAVLGIAVGLTITVAPLTNSVMTSVPATNSGTASAVNNVVSRAGGLLAVAGVGVALSAAYTTTIADRAKNLSGLGEAAKKYEGLTSLKSAGLPPPVVQAIQTAQTDAFHLAVVICAILAFAAGLISAVVLRNPTPSPQSRVSPERQAERV